MMKLTYLVLQKPIFAGLTEVEGHVVFTGDCGEMKIPLSEQDIEDIEQLLRVKTKVLAQEA